MTLRLLLSGRDLGAGLSVLEVAKAARSRGDIEVSILAQDPALDRMRAAGLEVEAFAAPPLHRWDEDGVSALRRSAEGCLERLRPDALLVGLSGPSFGVDEALLAAFEPSRSYAMQDFWGDMNLALGRSAGTYFVLDEVAARKTRERGARRAVAVGSPKHAAKLGLDIQGLRRERRASLGIEGSRAFVLFAGQPLWQLAGYGRTLAATGRALATQLPTAIIAYRPHPTETGEQSAEAARLLAEAGLPVKVDEAVELEASLAACDILLTSFSTVTYDHALLNRQSTLPLASALVLLFELEVDDCYRRQSSLDEVPLHDLGLTGLVRSADRLAPALREAQSMSERERAWHCAKTNIPDPRGASERIIETILDDLSRLEADRALAQ